MRKPWYYKARGTWCVYIDGSRIDLGPDEENAHEKWVAMLAAQQRKVDKDPTFGELAIAFVADSTGRVERGELGFDAHANYVWYIENFCRIHAGQLVSALEPHHITDWLAVNPTWGSSARRHAIGAVKRVLNWGRKERRIASNPLADVARPSTPRRTALVDDATHTKLVQVAGSKKYAGKIDRQFRLVLIALRLTGGRPQDIANVRVEHVDAAVTKWILPEHKTKRHTERPRIVYLAPCLQTITRMLMAGRTSGPLFQGRRGAVTTNSITCRLKRLKRDGLIDSDIVAYSYRHGLITQALERGVDVATVAELTGTSITMIQRHYGHLAANHQRLSEAAAKAVTRRHEA